MRSVSYLGQWIRRGVDRSSHSQTFFKIGVLKIGVLMKFTKFLRTSFFTEHLRWLLLSGQVTAVRTPKNLPFFSYSILSLDVFKFQCSSFLWWLCWHDNIFGADKHISTKSKLKFDKIPQDITSIIGRSMVIPLFKISGLSLLKAIC